MKRTNIYLNEKQHQKLYEQAEKEGVPVAELVRRAVDAFLLWYDPTYQPDPTHPKTRTRHSSPA
ncbi:ribbon-helix-helix domain-containing protein [Ktedonobacter racemifer]|uniref:CopG domain protein DNA-binding domain protein n=1 Tax=Ktedonobacter racemifer DSM 44963 TaxID=485913 RepID=D6U5M0_KTERA|nr:ribbon-helix-helix domain-containing protein [Ktedonobacter racemifer]EFH80281.1 CopG domain protein DNA-binding domain protein [Ktedonobacter racemifer DSM 44963]